MGEISELVAAFVLIITLPVVTISFLRNIATARPRPLSAAVANAQTLISRWAVWLALALSVAYGVLQDFTRWGLWETLVFLVEPSAGVGLVLLIWSIRAGRDLEAPAIEEPITTSERVEEHGAMQ